MLKAWTQHIDGGLLIFGLTFDAYRRNTLLYDRKPLRNFLVCQKEIIGSPDDVALITADSRAIIAATLSLDEIPILAGNVQPIWHFVRQKKERRVLHVCLSRDELLSLRSRPMLSFYRLSGKQINLTFDTLLVAGQNEDEMEQFFRRAALINETTRLNVDAVKLRC